MPNLKWTLSRLRQMGVAEVSHRVVDVARTVWESLAAASGWPECPEECLRLLGVQRAEEAVEAFRKRLGNLLQLSPATRAAEIAAVRDRPEAQRIIRQAEDILCHRVTLFGRTFEFGEEIDWHADLVHGRSIPLRFYSQLDYRDPALVGEVKLTWELNRHQHLLRLAQAYLLTRDWRYAHEIFAQIESWAEANPPLRGVNWTRALEISLRLLAWSWSLAAVSDVEGVPAERWARVLTVAFVQWDFLRRHLSYGSSANNHLLGELLGTAWAGAFLVPEHAAGETVQDALDRLFLEISRQVYPDGVSRELSLYYHAYVLLYGLLGLVLAEALGREVQAPVRQRLRDMGRFLAAVHLGDAVFPSLGDDDGGHVLPLAAEPNLPGDALGLWSVLFGEPLVEDLRPALGLGWWLLGSEGIQPASGTRAPEGSGQQGKGAADGRGSPGSGQDSQLLVFRDAGYVVHRVETDAGPYLVLFDAGPLGDDKLAAHGHADALSVFWAVEGEEILVDPGTFVYDGAPVWRDAFRGTPAHNTVTVDGEWQSRPGGTFLWLHRAEARLLEAVEREDAAWMVGEHDGYGRIGVRHRRGVLSIGGEKLVVTDWLDGRGRHKLEQRFHFLDGVLSWDAGRRVVQIDLVEHRVVIVPLGWPFELEAHRMAGPDEGGWLSRRFGEKEPAVTLVFRYDGELPAELATLFVVKRLDSTG